MEETQKEIEKGRDTEIDRRRDSEKCFSFLEDSGAQ